MDSTRLIQARQYYERVSAGEDKKSAALAIIGKKKFEMIEETDEYKAVLSAALNLEKEELKKDVEKVKRKQIKSYSKLLEDGDMLIESAETLEDRIRAHQNQRANLGSDVIERAIAWDGEDRNKDNYGGVLEGIIVS